MFPKIDTSKFPSEREQKLSELYRYSAYETMFYRSNLWMHTQRILWMLENMSNTIQKYLPDFDIEKARALALVHDDPEIITGDMPAHLKIAMNEKERAENDVVEMRAMNELASKYPATINGHNYKELLIDATQKNSIEAKVVSYIDKIDGYCESLHDFYAGNPLFTKAIIFYANATSYFPEKFPELKTLLRSKESVFVDLTVSAFDTVENKRFVDFGKPWTKEIINIKTDFPFYDAWRKLVIDRGCIDWLVQKSKRVHM